MGEGTCQDFSEIVQSSCHDATGILRSNVYYVFRNDHSINTITFLVLYLSAENQSKALGLANASGLIR